MVIIRKDSLIELWLGPPDTPESEFVGSWHPDYNREIVAALKRFEQSEGRQ